MPPARTTLSVHRNRPVHGPEDERLHLDVFEPEEHGPKPAVLLVHGGGFVVGRKSELAGHALELADRGYVVATSEYRLADEAPFPAALVDVKAAVAWLRTEGKAYGVDPRRIAAVGYSAGGNLAALAAVTAEDARFRPEAYPGVSVGVDAVVGYAGAYDVGPLDDDRKRRYLGVADGTTSNTVALASPLGQADVGTPPTLLIHGRSDEVVDPEQSEQFHRELAAVTDAELELLAGDGADHDFPVSAHTFDRTIESTASFLDRHL